MSTPELKASSRAVIGCDHEGHAETLARLEVARIELHGSLAGA